MSFSDPTFIGIDPTSGHKSFTYSALDKDLNLLALTDASMDEVLSFMEVRQAAVVAINAPAGVNQGLVLGRMKKEKPGPARIRGAEMRTAEYELRAHGIAVAGTPANAGSCSEWIQLGFELYDKLGKMGFKRYSQIDGSQARLVMETHPHACFCVMAGCLPLPKPSLEGKLQRQLLLHEHGVRIRDPMEFFEEITRYKMARGTLPFELLYLPEQLDALVAAYSAWLAVNKREQVSTVGDDREGIIVLPERLLQEGY